MNMVFWWLGQNTIATAILIPVAAIACRLFRDRPAVQHVLWVVVLLKFVTPPLVSWPWSVQHLDQSLQALVAPAADSPLDSVPLEQSGNHAFEERRPPLEIVLADPVLKETVIHQQETAPVDVVGIALGVAMSVWVVGAAICLGRQVRRIARHAAIVRQGKAAPRQLAEDIEAVAKQLSLRPPRTLIARGILSPFVWCLGRLQLIWPETMSGRDDIPRWRGVIAHELAHVRRGDHWVAWLELVAGIVWWWNPLFWFVRKRVRECSEMACDAMAIATCPENRREYAELLLELSAGFESGAPAPVLGVSTGPPSSFERRLSMILSDRVSGKVSLWGFLVAGGLALVALPAWSLGQQQPPPQVPPSGAADRDAKAADPRVQQLEAEIQRLTRLLEQSQKSGAPLKPPPVEKGPAEPEEKAKKDEVSKADRVKIALELAEAQRAVAEAEYQRAQKLFEKKLLSQEELTIAAARLRVAQAQMKQLQLDLPETPKTQNDPTVPPPAKPGDARPEGQVPSALDLADRYLKTVADLKVARSRVERMRKLEGAISKMELIEAEIELERAEKLEKFLSGFIKDAIASAARAKAAAEEHYQWSLQMAKKGYLSQSQVDASRDRLESLDARAKQFEAILSIVPGTPMK